MNIQRLIGLYCLAFLLAGCSNWLDVQPYDQISEDELVKSEEGFQKALNGIYIGLNDEALYGKSLTVEMIEIMGGAYEIGNESLVWGNYTDLKDYKFILCFRLYNGSEVSENLNSSFPFINCFAANKSVSIFFKTSFTVNWDWAIFVKTSI